jgi:hypothetical protein
LLLLFMICSDHKGALIVCERHLFG